MQPFGSVQLIKEQNAKLIEEKINELIKSGKYSSISDLKFKNRSFKDFCLNENYTPIYRAFSTIFTNYDYLILLDKLKEKSKYIENNESEIKKTTINDKTFIDQESIENENNESLVALEETSNNIKTKNDFLQAKKFDKPVANFIKKDDVNVSELSQEELKNYQSIQSITDDNVSIYHDENGNMTNIVKDDYNNYSTITEINGEQQMINHDSNNTINEKSKQKVLSKNTPKAPNISAAFTNTLILSFIIGSFFGVIFLAIYLKIMH